VKEGPGVVKGAWNSCRAASLKGQRCQNAMQGLDEAPLKLPAKAPWVVRIQAETINCRRFPLVIM